MNKKIKAVIFDWAGTTINFGCFAPLHVFIEIFEKRGLSITLEEARGPMGMLKKDHIREILKMPRVAELWENKFLKEASEEDVESLYADFEPSLMSSLKNYTKVIDGVLDVCKYLEEKEIRIGSTTGYTKEMMTVVAAGAKGNGYAPELIITADDTGSGRPAPFMIFENMKRLNVFPPQSVIKVGDTVSDILEGVNAGVWSVGVIKGSSVLGLNEEEYEALTTEQRRQHHKEAKQIFRRAGADYVLHDIKGLPQLISKINQKLVKG